MTRGVPGPTDRLRFREYTSEDLNFVSDLFSDGRARQFYPTMGDEARHRSWIDWNLASYRDHGFGLWVIELLDGAAQLGDCGLTFQDVAGIKMLEVGYHLVEEHRGRGYATEAAAVCLDYAFDVVSVETVCSIVDPRNEPSISVAARIHDERTSFIGADGNEMLLFTTERVHRRT
ncbi:MAG TPA: GNAT family N-acetyltransferase [Acidimicrobiia bacterium]|nr:GNAT family N-acetyltransferase [Acidimicrobiia bacterium]